MKKTRLAVLGILLGLFSCGNSDEGSGEIDIVRNERAFGIRHDKMLEDYESIATNISPYNTSDYPDFSSVVSFTYSLDGSDNYEFVASGVLINSKWVLTAAHNFFVSDEQDNPALVEGIKVLLGADPDTPSRTLDVEQLVFFPSWLNNSEVIENANDLCLVKLKESVAEDSIASFYMGQNEPIGNRVWFSGYGDYTKKFTTEGEYSPRHAIENILDRKVSNITSKTNTGVEYSGGLVAFDFDDPNSTVNALGDDFISQDENLLGAGSSRNQALDFEGTTIEGDSGGPLFSKIDNTWQVIGILSGGATEPIKRHKDGDYGDISIFTRVSSASSWISDVISNN